VRFAPVLVVLGALAGCRESSYALSVWRSGGDAALDIQFVNRMSGRFQLRNALVVIDDKVVLLHQEMAGVATWPPFVAPDVADISSGLPDAKDVVVYRGLVPVGAHRVGIRLLFGGGTDPIRGYWFDVKSHHDLMSRLGKTLRVTAIAYEKGGPDTPLEQRPTMEWREESVGELVAPTTAPAVAPVEH